MPGLDIVTFGCRLNAFESEVIRGAADAAGLGDAVIVNTCAVTEEAERQARQAIRRARREHPSARIIVTGCAATLAPQRSHAPRSSSAMTGRYPMKSTRTGPGHAPIASPRRRNSRTAVRPSSP